MKAVVTYNASTSVVTNEKRRPLSAADGWGACAFLIRNETGTATVYLEVDQAATATNGFPWKASDSSIEIVLECGQTLYGIVANAGADQELRILRSGSA